MAERVCCLYRVSTTKQVDHDDLNQADIPVQRKACRDFAQKMGWSIVGEEQEAGVSGYKVSANDRDKLQLIKKRAEQGKFDILLWESVAAARASQKCSRSFKSLILRHSGWHRS